MQGLLIMNRLPLPRHYDGKTWHTRCETTRRSIPKYLRDDLPDIRLIGLRERLREVQKFNCPRLSYFNEFFKKHKSERTKQRSNCSALSERQLVEQLQYALITCDRESCIVDQLVEKGKQLPDDERRQQKKKKRANQGNQMYFDDTLELVLRNWKNQFVSRKKQELLKEEESLLSKIGERIVLLPIA